jgi:hypothetical protein
MRAGPTMPLPGQAHPTTEQLFCNNDFGGHISDRATSLDSKADGLRPKLGLAFPARGRHTDIIPRVTSSPAGNDVHQKLPTPYRG